MSPILAFTLAVAMLGGTSSPALQRDSHDDTIYVVGGTPDQLSRFQQDIGSHWEGGRLLKKDRGVYNYWAFPDRTAPQARELMFGALSAGLTLDIREYDQSLWFPAARSQLDEIAISCGLHHDPFFVSPAGELQISFKPDDPEQAAQCARQKVSSIKLSAFLMRRTN